MTIFSEEMLDALREHVKVYQNKKRFRHTCGVEAEAAYLGQCYLPEQVSELRAAALLHDLTKCVSDDEQVALCESYGIPLSDIDRRTPQTLHGKSAEETIKREFPLYATPAILQAVRLHTTGGAEMSTFDKIIFLSDYIEAGRPYKDCKIMREKVHAVCERADIVDLDRALCEVFRLTVLFFRKENTTIHPATYDAYRALTGEDI